MVLAQQEFRIHRNFDSLPNAQDRLGPEPKTDAALIEELLDEASMLRGLLTGQALDKCRVAGGCKKFRLVCFATSVAGFFFKRVAEALDWFLEPTLLQSVIRSFWVSL